MRSPSAPEDPEVHPHRVRVVGARGDVHQREQRVDGLGDDHLGRLADGGARGGEPRIVQRPGLIRHPGHDPLGALVVLDEVV